MFGFVDDENNGYGDDEKSYTAGKYLKTASGWNGGGNGTDAYGFSALPGGYGLSTDFFEYAGRIGRWWSTNDMDQDNAYHWSMEHDSESASRDWETKNIRLSVRCLQKENGK